MNRALFLSAILLTASGCSANNDGLGAVRSEADLSRADAIDGVFVSTQTFEREFWVPVVRPDGSPGWEPRTFQVKARLKMIKAADFTLDDAPSGLDYEAVLEFFVEATGQTFSDDNAYYFVRKDVAGYTFFNCSSTRRCYSESDTTKMDLSDTAEGRKLVVDAVVGLSGQRVEFLAPPR